MQKIFHAIIGALDAEISEFIRHLEKPRKNQMGAFVFHEGQFHGKDVVVVKSGVGKVFAAMTAQKLIDEYKPKWILFTGVAGGVNPTYNIGDIIVCRDCVQHDLDATSLDFPRGQIPYTSYRYFETDIYLRKLAFEAPVEHVRHTGRILTGDQFLTQREMQHYGYLKSELNGDAVEMEGAAVGQVCTINHIPFLIIRTISDKADGEAPENFNRFLPEIVKNSYQIVQYILKEY
ncbi:MAG: 5'-methylthioadenosine/adenosylhomocysteine nucleosidase [Bacteroidales bacterium]